ncbi:MAG: hypothetical protein WCX91_02210 [Candidatus Omnitrophota bacterium]|jgi:hypothetical protein
MTVMTVYIILIVSICFIAWIFLLLPSIAYLRTRWINRFEVLKSFLDEKALEFYFKKFFPAKKHIKRENFRGEFEKLFFQNYGRHHYILPLILLALISLIGMLLVLNNLFVWLKIYPILSPISPIAISAFLGAYMWVAYDQLQRFRTRNFTSHDVCICSFRFLIAIPLGFSFAAIFNDAVGITSAFLLGTFPADTLFKYSRRYVNQKMNVTDQSDQISNELEQLQSINREEAERYRNEDITNILELAYADPVDLTIRTNFDFNYVLDCSSQALLWLYLGKNIEKVRTLGLRGAQEAAVLYEGLNSSDNNVKKIAEDNLRGIVKTLSLDENAFKITLIQIAEDPYTKFICNIWALKD